MSRLTRNSQGKCKSTIDTPANNSNMETLPETLSDKSVDITATEVCCESSLETFIKTSLTTVTNQLSSMEHTLNKVARRQDEFYERLVKVERNQKDFKSSLEFMDRDLNETKQDITESLKPKVQAIEQSLKSLQQENYELKNRLLEQERYSRGYNLRFGGVSESDGENPINIVNNIVKNMLKLPDIQIENAHRIGLKKIGQTRHIIAKFIYRPQRREVLYQSKLLLKDNPLYVVEDLTKEDKMAKDKFKPFMAQCFKEGKKVRFARGKLYVDGREVKEGDIGL